MTPALQEYLEREYSDFENSYFQDRSFWRTPISSLKGTSLFSFFEEFCELFPDHASEHNTVFYLTGSSDNYQILLVCTHFEHDCLTDVRELMNFLEKWAPSFARSDGSVHLELLDGNGEKLRVRFYDPSSNTVNLLQKHSTRIHYKRPAESPRV